MMQTKRLPPLLLAKRISIPGLLIGFMAVVFGVYESGLIMEYVFSIGLGIMAASMMIFGFGLVLALMEDIKSRTPDPQRDRNTA
ncbi:hypothetical protein [Gorillibacterium sp. sgz5001074]|uniref:hypothetical protein n=1 Tax=Gorillibacterium sp. sgz5001074 TaxID=3446695 RepID=UPI003F66EA8A